MYNEKNVQQIRNLLSGLAGYQEQSFEEKNVEIWQVKFFKFKVIWNTYQFNIFYEDQSTTEKISRVMKDTTEDFISLSDFYDMIKEVADGLRNSYIIESGNNYTEQDIRDANELSKMLISKVDTLLEIIYKEENSIKDESESPIDTIYLLIKEYISPYGFSTEEIVEGFTTNELTAKQYAARIDSFKQKYNNEEYPKFKYKEIKRLGYEE